MHSSTGVSRTLRRGSAVLVFLLAASAAWAQHPAINLFDKDANIINPVAGQNDRVPFSTENTCGLCHDYQKITSGYHFQMGWNHISDDYGEKERKPWILSDGLMGRWYPYAFRQLAKKKNASPDDIDLTVYDFVGFSRAAADQPPCGSCHPGGGGLQADREGHRYDQYLKEHPELRESLDGDYYQSRWDRSGVVEADCFICHFRGYNFEERINQLEQGNYQWALVSATGIGIVEGSVAAGNEPKLTYNTRLFNSDGTITLGMSWPPPADNCVNCHGRSDVKKRGFSWNDIHNPDIHNQARLACSACHTAGLDHQITKGTDNVARVASNLNNTMKNCRECHFTGYMAAPMPRHTSIRPSHLDRIACEACHIPHLNRAAALGMEASSGKLIFYPNPSGAKAPGELAEWQPVYQRRPTGIIFPYNSFLSIWWGNLDADGILYPLFLREHAAAWKLYADNVTDDNGDGIPEVNREEEIVAGLKAFSISLKGNRRFRQVHPVLVKADKAYELDGSGRLSLLRYDLTGMSTVNFAITHNVSPYGFALGSRTCGDCHAESSHFFMGRRITDMYDAQGIPVTQPIGLSFGCNIVAFRLNSFHQQILSPMVSLGVIVVVFLIVVHYHSYGPKRIPFVPFSGEVRRFNLLERAIHLARLISFVVLAGTGLIMAFNLTAWQELFFKSPQQMRLYHIGLGIVFIVTTVMGIAVWFKDAFFASYDREWVRLIGGYLGHKGDVPAGRFNAGQKMFYWYTAIFGLAMSVTGILLIYKYDFSLPTICVTSTIHNLVGFFLIAGVLSHAYLGTIANPGTWRVLVDGYVTREWAQHHHPYWYRMLMKKQRTGNRDNEKKDEGANPPA
jgi:formate dehydrogenase gamma subunit